jgi:hypothetical protein
MGSGTIFFHLLIINVNYDFTIFYIRLELKNLV